MEIDLPRAPIESVKDFFIHLFTITVGILIALGLEQSLEAYHHYQLANEARANIVSELQDNKHSLDDLIGGMKKIEREHQHVTDVVNQLIRTEG